MGPRQRQGRSRSKTHALPIILLSFLGFLLIAGVAFGIGMVGNVNRWLSDLPDYTDANAYLVSEPTEIVDCNGNKIASFYTQNRKSITKDEVSPYVLQGTVDVEDERFYEHGGIDLWGIARAAVATLGGGHEGASTITQQLVRNTILQEEQFDSTIERKVREAYIAVKMEDMYSKDEILMMYLNTIYYGHGAYGIEAAAETYLSKSAADLTLSEAALLIGLPNSPSQYGQPRPGAVPSQQGPRQHVASGPHYAGGARCRTGRAHHPQRDRNLGQRRRCILAALLCRLC